MIILEGMESEISIEPVSLSSNKNHDEDVPTLTENNVREEAYQWLEAINIKIRALEKIEIQVKVNKSQLPTNANIIPFTWYFKRNWALDVSLCKHKAILFM